MWNTYVFFVLKEIRVGEFEEDLLKINMRLHKTTKLIYSYYIAVIIA